MRIFDVPSDMNAMARWNGGPWLPVRMDGDCFLDFMGLKVTMPDEHRMATPTEIEAELKAENRVLVRFME